GMVRQLNNPASLAVMEVKSFLTLTINDHKTVTGFQVDNAVELIQPTEEKINEAANTRAVTYELDDLLSIIDARVQYTVGTHSGDQPLRLAFNEDSLQAVDEVKEPEENVPVVETVRSGEEVNVSGKTIIQVKDSEVEVTTPTDLPNGTKIQIDLVDEAEHIKEGFEVAGSIIDVTLNLPNDDKGFDGEF